MKDPCKMLMQYFKIGIVSFAVIIFHSTCCIDLSYRLSVYAVLEDISLRFLLENDL